MELHLKYRPKDFDEVLGHKTVLESIKQTLTKSRSRAFLFTGPSGVGKTTLARILARTVGVDPGSPNCIELDAATRTGVDSVREIQDLIQYAPIGKTKNRVIILDEAHMLTRGAWNALLKSVEEPPPGVYWAFCTTEPGKIPDTILTRCAHYSLDLVSEDDIFHLLESVAAKEHKEGTMENVPEEVLELVSRKAGGSPRQALVFLAKVAHCGTKKEAIRVLRALEAGKKEVIDLCRLLAKGGTWEEALTILSAIENTSGESVRRVVQAYFVTWAMKEKRSTQAARICAVLEAFQGPYSDSDSMAPVLLSLGQLLLEQ